MDKWRSLRDPAAVRSGSASARSQQKNPAHQAGRLGSGHGLASSFLGSFFLSAVRLACWPLCIESIRVVEADSFASFDPTVIALGAIVSRRVADDARRRGPRSASPPSLRHSLPLQSDGAALRHSHRNSSARSAISRPHGCRPKRHADLQQRDAKSIRWVCRLGRGGPTHGPQSD